MEQNEKTVQLLNNLIENSRQGSETYRTVAKNLGNEQLKSTFSNLERKHSQIVTNLEEQVRVLGASPSKTSASSTVWGDSKAGFASSDQKTILDKLERGESALEAQFDKALQQGSLPANIKDALKQQHDNQRDARDMIRRLKTNI